MKSDQQKEMARATNRKETKKKRGDGRLGRRSSRYATFLFVLSLGRNVFFSRFPSGLLLIFVPLVSFERQNRCHSTSSFFGALSSVMLHNGDRRRPIFVAHNTQHQILGRVPLGFVGDYPIKSWTFFPGFFLFFRRTPSFVFGFRVQ